MAVIRWRRGVETARAERQPSVGPGVLHPVGALVRVDQPKLLHGCQRCAWPQHGRDRTRRAALNGSPDVGFSVERHGV